MSAHVLDSSGWIECLDGGPNTPHFAPVLRRLPDLIIPAIVLTEVRKVVLKHRTREQADDIARTMRTGEIVSIDEDIALAAADFFIQFKLPLADSLIYAVSRARHATLWTQDEHFKDLPHVKFFPKRKAPGK
ncbi:MAG: type II toxin-antitoxin system VapC family toxin [Verrucomicrobiae bacterium]